MLPVRVTVIHKLTAPLYPLQDFKALYKYCIIIIIIIIQVACRVTGGGCARVSLKQEGKLSRGGMLEIRGGNVRSRRSWRAFRYCCRSRPEPEVISWCGQVMTDVLDQ